MKWTTIPSSALREQNRFDATFWLTVSSKIEELGLGDVTSDTINLALDAIVKEANEKIDQADRLRREAREIFERAIEAKQQIALIKGVQHYRK